MPGPAAGDGRLGPDGAQPAAVRSCAAAVGPSRIFFATADTVADIEALRHALGVARLTLDGVSYGSYVAEQFCADPSRPGAGWCLTRSCRAGTWTRCSWPACGRPPRCCAPRARRNAATSIRPAIWPSWSAGTTTGAVLDTLVEMSVSDPSFPGVPAALHAAAAGRPASLNALIARVHAGDATTRGELSQGLHASTLCAGVPDAVGRPGHPARGAARRAGPGCGPADHGSGLALRPGHRGGQRPHPDLPVLAARSRPRPPPPPPAPACRRSRSCCWSGGHDLSTPLADARAQAALAPDGRLLVVQAAGHSVQNRAAGNPAQAVVSQFLHGG